ncbi:MAG TPA: hypothetical protein VKE71_15525 [Candidatus Angelobacter sp.]|nr:hypothetical protein [Candidatus Angelobacter sp.]
MPKKRSKSSRTFSRHVAPFAPVALALAMNMAPSNRGKPVTTPPPGGFTQSCSAPHFPIDTPEAMDTGACGIAGKGGAETTQNEAKNNFCAPDPAKPVTLADMLALQQKVQQDSSIHFGNTRSHPLSSGAGPQQDRAPLVKLGEGDEVVIQGFVLIARQEGAESVNCGKNVPDDPTNHDIHISLVQNPGDAECSSIVVEMTPHHRPEEWTPKLVNEVAHAKLLVQVTGQRMFDSSHSPCSNGTPVSGDPRRASLWEVHPIYKFEVCPQGNCSSGGWVPLELWKPESVELP